MTAASAIVTARVLKMTKKTNPEKKANYIKRAKRLDWNGFGNQALRASA